CILMLGYALSEEGRRRAEIMEQTTDGFKISEADLEMRGPGEFLGTRQSGLPGFRMANLVRDLDLLQQARNAAFQWVKNDPKLKNEQSLGLKENLDKQLENWVG
ncbi:ATP-dependent DNA helicase RecG, partial [bacterium]|nr:ATP-dependent DNA helicase RecG [bacterium]